MPASNVLICVVDGLRASALGAYGNTTYPTPALDRFAAESFLLDWCFAPSAELASVVRALWQSLHPLRSEEQGAGSGPLRELGFNTTLVTDDATLPALPTAATFDHCVQLADDLPADRTGRFSDELHDDRSTALARLFATACDAIAPGDAQLVWVHSRGMYGPWDAPRALQQSLLDADDPPPLEFVAPPNLHITDADDPDTAFRYGCAYAAQVMVLDACWEQLMACVATVAGAPWLVMLLGARGFPLAEHGRVGGVDQRLFADQLHVPWLVRLPDGAGRLARCGQLTSHLDLLPALAEWCGKAQCTGDGASLLQVLRRPNAISRDWLISSDVTGSQAIRTPGWSLRRDGADQPAELYVRPDDRWEANNVATLCPDVVEGLASVLDQATAEIAAGRALPTLELAEELRSAHV